MPPTVHEVLYFWLFDLLFFNAHLFTARMRFMLFVHPCTLALQILVIMFCQPEPCIAESWCFVTECYLKWLVTSDNMWHRIIGKHQRWLNAKANFGFCSLSKVFNKSWNIQLNLSQVEFPQVGCMMMVAGLFNSLTMHTNSPEFHFQMTGLCQYVYGLEHHRCRTICPQLFLPW